MTNSPRLPVRASSNDGHAEIRTAPRIPCGLSARQICLLGLTITAGIGSGFACFVCVSEWPRTYSIVTSALVGIGFSAMGVTSFEFYRHWLWGLSHDPRLTLSQHQEALKTADDCAYSNYLTLIPFTVVFAVMVFAVNAVDFGPELPRAVRHKFVAMTGTVILVVACVLFMLLKRMLRAPNGLRFLPTAVSYYMQRYVDPEQSNPAKPLHGHRTNRVMLYLGLFLLSAGIPSFGCFFGPPTGYGIYSTSEAQDTPSAWFIAVIGQCGERPLPVLWTLIEAVVISVLCTVAVIAAILIPSFDVRSHRDLDILKVAN